MNNLNGKRGLEGEDDQQPDRKRPALASVIVEALKVDSLQRLCSSLEPILRRVVSEEVERALAKLGAASLGGRSPPKQIEGSDGKSLQLHFKSRVSLPLFTGGKVEGEHGAAIHIVLLDAKTGHLVTSGFESSLKLDVLVLEGDFNNEDDEEWTQEEFENRIVKEREGKRPLLTGDLQVTLKEGVGTLGDLTFTDNSSWIRSRKFRLGLKVTSGFGKGTRIREGKTEAFAVRDHRGELYKKHYPPALNDEVWRLEKIGKDGSFHKRLNNAGIISVQDFLRQSVRDRHGLRNILGNGMSNKMWDALIEHANTCALTGTMYVYYSDETKNTGVLFNNIYELRGLIIGERYYSSDCLSESQKVYVDTLVKRAYENWNQVTEYDRETFMSFAQEEQLSAARNEPSMVSVDFSGTLDHHVQHTHQQQPVLSGQSSSAPVQHDGGYNSGPSIKYHTSVQDQLNGASFRPHDHLIRDPQLSLGAENDYSGRLAPSPTETSTTGIQPGNCSVQPFSLNLFDDWSHNRDNGVEEFLSEEEIRIKSHEMLENEDMQQLLRIFSMGGQASLSTPEDGYGFPSYMPSPSLNHTFDEDRGRPGKAVVGWLKIKAAMRWGFFIRKKAAEKRARLVELDDE